MLFSCIYWCLVQVFSLHLPPVHQALSRPDVIEAILCFFVNLANSTKVNDTLTVLIDLHCKCTCSYIWIYFFLQGAELLQVNNVSQLLSITLGNVVNKLDTMVG